MVLELATALYARKSRWHCGMFAIKEISTCSNFWSWTSVKISCFYVWSKKTRNMPLRYHHFCEPEALGDWAHTPGLHEDLQLPLEFFWFSRNKTHTFINNFKANKHFNAKKELLVYRSFSSSRPQDIINFEIAIVFGISCCLS